MTSPLIETIRSTDDDKRHRSLESLVDGMTAAEMLHHCEQLDAFRRRESNLYARVRALFFLSAIHRYHLPDRLEREAEAAGAKARDGRIPFEGYEHLLSRRFGEAIDNFLDRQTRDGASDALCSALA